MVIKCLLFTLFALINCDEGRREPTFRIVGGDPTTIENHPYQVSIRFLGKHICGGSLISLRHVLTAAHCIYLISSSFLKIRVGSSLVDEGGRVISVSGFKSHPEYRPPSLKNDLSILSLSQSIERSGSISPIELPKQDTSIGIGIYGNATGWGMLSEKGTYPKELQRVELPTISHADCVKAYKGHVINDRMICAGFAEGGMDACKDDSGGPFVIDNVLVGVTSWGEGCAQAGKPGVYTKVSSFLEFINSNIN